MKEFTKNNGWVVFIIFWGLIILIFTSNFSSNSPATDCIDYGKGGWQC